MPFEIRSDYVRSSNIIHFKEQDEANFHDVGGEDDCVGFVVDVHLTEIGSE